MRLPFPIHNFCDWCKCCDFFSLPVMIGLIFYITRKIHGFPTNPEPLQFVGFLAGVAAGILIGMVICHYADC